MIGTKELCALLLGTSLGVGGTVAVKHKQHSPRKEVSKAKQPGKRASNSSPVVRQPAPRPAATLLDCPLPAPSLGGQGFTFPAPPSPFGAVGWGSPQPGPVWISPNNHTGPTFPPAIPEPDAWAMLVAGFGLVGLACRRRKVAL